MQARAVSPGQHLYVQHCAARALGRLAFLQMHSVITYWALPPHPSHLWCTGSSV